MDRQSHRAQSQRHHLEKLQHAERLPLRLQDLYRVEERTVCNFRLRRAKSLAADVHVPKALLQRREQVVLSAAIGWGTLNDNHRLRSDLALFAAHSTPNPRP